MADMGQIRKRKVHARRQGLNPHKDFEMQEDLSVLPTAVNTIWYV